MADEPHCPIHCIETRYCAEIDHNGLEPCGENPELLKFAPIGQYHCPDCGCMVLAGLAHLPHDHGCWRHLEVRGFLEEMFQEWVESTRTVKGEHDPSVFDDPEI